MQKQVQLPMQLPMQQKVLHVVIVFELAGQQPVPQRSLQVGSRFAPGWLQGSSGPIEGFGGGSGPIEAFDELVWGPTNDDADGSAGPIIDDAVAFGGSPGPIADALGDVFGTKFAQGPNNDAPNMRLKNT